MEEGSELADEYDGIILEEGLPKMIRHLSLASFCFLLSATLCAQSNPSAEGPGFSVIVGAGFSTFNPDYGCGNSSPFTCWNHQLIGISPFVGANRMVFQRLYLEGEARFLYWHGPANGLTESSYLGGPSFHLLHYRKRLLFSARFLLGGAQITIPNDSVGSGNYFALAPGAVFDYRMTKRLSARAEYEYQIWPSFKGIPTATTTGSGGLTPNGFTFGVSYTIFPW
jgi:hypothetical protein